ncbi:MAG TPA: alpha/beta hydrolase-fold protein [Candidatus Elarobacter sp.]
MRRETVVRGFAALAGAGALGGCGTARVLRDRVRGCGDAAIPPDDGEIIMVRGDLPTKRTGASIRYALATPADVDPHHIAAVAYVLPGRGATAEGVLVGLGFRGFLAALSRAKAAPMILATIDAGESYFHARTSGEDRLAAVTVDLAKFVRELAGRPVREALIGQSMGGYGALLAAEREPARYRAVAVAGPALFPSYADERASVGDAFDDRADFARNDVIGHASRLRGVPVMVRCGDQDPFAPAVRAFATRCPSADVRIVRGCHTDGFWRATATELLKFTAAHL